MVAHAQVAVGRDLVAGQEITANKALRALSRVVAQQVREMGAQPAIAQTQKIASGLRRQRVVAVRHPSRTSTGRPMRNQRSSHVSVGAGSWKAETPMLVDAMTK